GINAKNQADHQALFLSAMDDTDREGDGSVIERGITIDPEASKHARERADRTGTSFTPPRKNEKEREIERRLTTPVTLHCTEAHARGALTPTTYQVADLVIPVENYGTLGAPPPVLLGTQTNMPAPSTPTPITPPLSLSGGAPAGTATGLPSQSSMSGGPFQP